MYDHLSKYMALTRYASFYCIEFLQHANCSAMQIFTFDDYGVSSHPNHFSLCQGANHLIRTLSHSDPPKSKGKAKSPPTKVPRLFTLRSVSLPDKYSGELPLAFVVPSQRAKEMIQKGEMEAVKASIIKVKVNSCDSLILLANALSACRRS